METTDNQFKLTPVLQKRFEQFKKIPDHNKRFERIIELGKRLPDFSDDSKTEENKVYGCASLVYVLGELKEGKIYYQGWSNSHLVKGLLALLVEGMSGSETDSILDINPQFMEDMGLAQTLTASRANGFLNTFTKMQAIAKNYKNV